jgi:hypothetical protein
MVYHHNCIILRSETCHAIEEIERIESRVNAWCILSYLEVLGPFFFVEQTVTAMTYLGMVQLYLLPSWKIMG